MVHPLPVKIKQSKGVIFLCITQTSLHTLLLARRTMETLKPRAAPAGQFAKPFPVLCVLLPVC